MDEVIASDDKDGALAKPDKKLDPDRAAARIKAKESLIAALAGGDFSNQQTKVAYILNLHPPARNSDVALSLKYWETFQPDIYDPNGIKPADFFKLDRVPFLVRARAKIQNEYELFQAEEKVRRRRKGREDDMQEAVLADPAPRPVLQVFSDETGKGEDNVIIGSVWALNGRAVYDVSTAIKRWQAQSKFETREIHFSALSKGDIVAMAEYINVVASNREFLSFKLIAMNKRNSRRSIEEILHRLHELMLVRGMRHEVASGRVAKPRQVSVTMDDEQSMDRIALADIRNRVADGIQRERLEGLTLDDSFMTVSSKISPLVQLADVIAGAANRKLNFKGERNAKDEIADYVIDTLQLSIEEVPSDLDAGAFFRV